MNPIIYTNDPAGIGVLHQTNVTQTAPLHTHKDFIEAFLVIEGKALHMVNDNVDLLTAGSFVFVRQFDVHRYNFYQSNQFDFYNISLPAYEIDKVFHLFHNETGIHALFTQTTSPIIQFCETELGEVRLEFETIIKLVSTQQYTYAKSRFKVLLCNVFLHYIESYNLQKDTNKSLPEWLSDLITIMYRTDNMQQGLHAMINISGYSQEYLNRVFKKYLDLTPTQFINNLRLNYSASLLTASSIDILDICENCGFHNLSHFYHLFKKFYGTSPRQYHQLHKGSTPSSKIKV